jgi:coenzyme F420 biosynthesis associated uncharacterized protein
MASGTGSGGPGSRPDGGSPEGNRGTGGGRGRISEERLWGLGFLIGSALGAAVTVAGRQVERTARRAGLVDWDRVEDIAIARLRRAPGALDAAALRATEGAYADAMARVVPALGAHLETQLPGVVERVSVVDRAAWVRANTAAFAGLIGRLEGELLDQMLPPGSGLAKATVTLANRWITTRQLGLLLGFMGQRVLGQYDIALLTAETTPGRLLFVEENIRRTASVLGVPLVPFRTWIALHETTHAFEFEAHPWLRPYLAERLERQLTLFSNDASSMGRDAARVLGAALRGEGRRDDQHWMERLMSDEQRRLFRETQAVMSLLEGFGDHVMDAVGHDLVPGVERISARFHGRREQRTPFERAMLRITGMDLKMEQYRKGEAFVAAIDRRGGAAALRRLWDGPETLPSADEIEAPDAWLRRMGLDADRGRG